MNYNYSNLLQSVSNFYMRWEGLSLKVTFVLVSLQVIHLIWLSCFVFGVHLPLPDIVFASIDFLEIPALVSGIVFYSAILFYYRKRKEVLYIGLLAIQFVHLWWITDTFVYIAFNFGQYVWLAVIAIAIDYLELPVVYDLYKRIRNR